MSPRLHERLLKNGYARLPRLTDAATARGWGDKVATAAVAEARACAACETLPTASLDLASPCFTCERTEGKSKSFFRARRLVETDERLRELVHSPVLARAVAEAMHVPKLRLYQASAFVKTPGDEMSGWHQDAAACPLDTDRLATLWLALGDVEPDAGPLVFAQGSHLPGVPVPSLRDVSVPKRLVEMRAWTTEEVQRLTQLKVTAPGAMAAWDATLHLGWTLHASPPNLSNTTRIALAITYFADGARVHRDLLRLEGSTNADGAWTGGEAEEGGKGIRFLPEEGGALIVRLLADDAGTWQPWLGAMPPLLVPGQRVQSPTLTPLLYDATAAQARG
jgi:hypothetical protein